MSVCVRLLVKALLSIDVCEDSGLDIHVLQTVS